MDSKPDHLTWREAIAQRLETLLPEVGDEIVAKEHFDTGDTGIRQSLMKWDAGETHGFAVIRGGRAVPFRIRRIASTAKPTLDLAMQKALMPGVPARPAPAPAERPVQGGFDPAGFVNGNHKARRKSKAPQWDDAVRAKVEKRLEKLLPAVGDEIILQREFLDAAALACANWVTLAKPEFNKWPDEKGQMHVERVAVSAEGGRIAC